MTTIIWFRRSRRSKFSDKPETYSQLYTIGCDHADRLDVLMAFCLRSGGVENACFTETSGTLRLYSENCSGKFLFHQEITWCDRSQLQFNIGLCHFPIAIVSESLAFSGRVAGEEKGHLQRNQRFRSPKSEAENCPQAKVLHRLQNPILQKEKGSQTREPFLSGASDAT